MAFLIDENVSNSEAVRPPPRAAGLLQRWFKKRDPVAGTPGTTLDETFFNDLLGMLRHIFTQAGQAHTLGAAGDPDLIQAITTLLGSATSFYTDGGAADAYVLTETGASAAPSSYAEGALYRFRPANANTGASTIDVSGLGVKNLVRPDGSALVAGDLHPNHDARTRYDSGGDEVHLLNPLGLVMGFEFFESAALDPTTTQSVAHGLTGTPRFYTAIYRCKAANNGFAIGDELAAKLYDDQTTFGAQIWVDAANMGFDVHNNQGERFEDKGGGNNFQIIAAEWDLFLRAWR